MSTQTISATAIAHPNIALIKYWGDNDPNLHLPNNGSISITLAELLTHTTVVFDPQLSHDRFALNGAFVNGSALERVSKFLDHVRKLAGMSTFANVESENNFPISAGIASSASGFAALSLAASTAAGLNLDERALSRLARLGSGSACRSIPGGFVEWRAGSDDMDSYAFSIASPDFWDLADCIAIVDAAEKQVSSSLGHSMAGTSILQPARIADAPRRLEMCRKAILERDFDRLAQIVEIDSNLMHAVMFTSQPPIIFWQPATLSIMHAVQACRQEGLPVCYTIDAGPNVHVLCRAENAKEIAARLGELKGVMKVIISHPGGHAQLV
jgi:diphosphomevalonate decarboxylase